MPLKVKRDNLYRHKMDRQKEQANSTAQNSSNRGSFFILFLYFSTAFIFTKLHYLMTIEHIPATLYKLITHSAQTPSQYRILVVWIIRCFYFLTPIKNIYIWEQIVKLVFLFAAMVALRKWLSLFVKPSLATVGPFLLAIIFPFSFIVRYPNDFPQIFFFTILLYLLYKKKWAFYYPLFAIATFNKETTIMLILIFLLTQAKQITRRELLCHVFAQLIIWIQVKLFLYLFFYSNIAAQYQFQLYKNIAHLMFKRGPGLVLQILSAFGFFWIIVFHKFKQLPMFIRRSSLTLIPYALIMLCVGMINETRIWYEYIPIILAIVLINVERIETGRSN